MENISLKQISDVLFQGVRTQETLKISKPFLQAIARQLEEQVGNLDSLVSLPSKEGTGSGKNIQYVDRAFFELVPDLKDNKTGAINSFSLGVILRVDGLLWWGGYAWGGGEFIDDFKNTLENLDLVNREDHIDIGKGTIGAGEAWEGGKYYALGHELDSNGILDVDDLESLIGIIVGDLILIHERFSPHKHSIQDKMQSEPKTWIFQANPKIYDLERSLRNERLNDWRVTRYRSEIKIGDQIIFWKAGKKRGVYGLGKVISDLYQKSQGDWVVDVEYQGRVSKPVLYDDIKDHPILSNMMIMKVSQGTNFPVKTEEWSALKSMLGDLILPERGAKDGREEPKRSPYEAERVLKKVFSNIHENQSILGLFTNSIELAHERGEDKWSITLTNDQVRLNVCKVIVASLEDNRLWLAIDTSKLQEDELRGIMESGLYNDMSYKLIPDSAGIYISEQDLGNIPDSVGQAHLSLIEKAAQLSEKIPSNIARGYSPGILNYLEKLFRKSLPRPQLDIFTPNVWWVNQGTSYSNERDGGYMWAPLADRNGHPVAHWNLLEEVTSQDVVVHYSKGEIRALSCVKEAAVESPKPEAYEAEPWEEKGRLVKVEHFDLNPPIPLGQVQEELNEIEITQGPLNREGRVNQGYLWRFTPEAFQVIRDASTQDWPEWAMLLLEPGDGEVIEEQFELGTHLQNTLMDQGLLFTPWQVATFYTALQTKGFVILSGISGTGKTKLAQHFAAILPQPDSVMIPLDEQISITIQPYMLKYNRFIIPKSATRFFEPPPPGETVEISINFDGNSVVCRFTHVSLTNTDYIHVLLKGEVRNWFHETFNQGDILIIEPELDTDDNLTGFTLFDAKSLAEKQDPKTIKDRNWLFIPVRPDWRDSKSLLGYYNPLTSSFVWTPFLRFLLRAHKSYQKKDGFAWFVILDEMNLARVEYYFADLLSVLESGRNQDGWTREPLQFSYPDDAEGDLPPREIRISPNIYIVGTVNVDETTHAFSPKVLDRAFTLELTDTDFNEYPLRIDSGIAPTSDYQRQKVLENFAYSGSFIRLDKTKISRYIDDHPHFRKRLQVLNESLLPYEFHFGYRIFDEIISFMLSVERNELYEDLGGKEIAFDAAVLMKVLPKFHGSRGKLEAPLKTILAWCINPDTPDIETVNNQLKEIEMNNILEKMTTINYKYPRTARRAQRMLWSLYTTGFAAFG